MQTPEQSSEEILQHEQPENYSDEDVLKGFIYPPPPSFYQRQQVVQQKLSERPIPPARYIPEAAQAKTNYVPPKIPSTTRLAQASVRTSAQAQPAQNGRVAKRSRKWIWIVVSILAASLVISCSLCGWAGYNLFSTQFQEALGARDSVNNYYRDMQAKNYSHAYTYLDLTKSQNSLSQEQFIQQATQQDNSYGSILSYTPDTPTFSTDTSQGTDINHSTVTVNIGRKQKQYLVTLTLNREGNIWKIVEYTKL